MKRLMVAGLLLGLSSSWASPGITGERAHGTTTVQEQSNETPAPGVTLRWTAGTEFQKLGKRPLVLGSPGTPPVRSPCFFLKSGRVEVDIKQAPGGPGAVLFLFDNDVSAVARVGKSEMVALPESVSVVTRDAQMLVAKDNKWKGLTPGLVRSFDFERGVVEQRPLAAPPNVSLNSSLAAVAPGERWDIPVRLQGQPNALRYQVELSYRTEDGRVERRQIDVMNPKTVLSGTRLGSYEVSARSVDRYGVMSQRSEPVPFRTFSYELPKAARAEGNHVRMDKRQRLPLLAAEDLQMSYGRSDYFVKAPNNVGLQRGKRTLVRFRQPGSTDEAALILEPRDLRADVAITPRRPTFPRDALRVEVELFAEGSRPARTAEVEPTVTLNLNKLELDWTRKGNRLTTTVPPATGPGPWVVRVEVQDRLGNPVGRNFIEVAATPKPVAQR